MSSSHHDARPPHSRLFVVCGRGVREDELESFFAAHGEIQSARVVEAKGVAYVKFALASCATRAVETHLAAAVRLLARPTHAYRPWAGNKHPHQGTRVPATPGLVSTQPIAR